MQYFFNYTQYNAVISTAWENLYADALYQSKARTPAGIYLLKVNIRNTRARCEICSDLTIKTPERRHWRRSSLRYC